MLDTPHHPDAPNAPESGHSPIPPAIPALGGPPMLPSEPLAVSVSDQPSHLPAGWLLDPELGYAAPPPIDGPTTTRQAGQPGRHRWFYPLLAVLLLAVLGIGILIGTAIAGARTVNTVHTVTIGARSAPAITISSATTSLQQSVETVTKAVQPSVVEVTSLGGQQEAIGSGEVLTANGYIVTNDHVVQGFNSYTVTFSNGTALPAQLVGQDAQDDLAVLKVAATNLQPIAFGDSSAVQVGEFAVAVGNPLGLQQTATFGIVSALNRSASEAPDGPAGELTGLIQTSAQINRGNSGGALVNLQGQLIGIPTLGAIDPSTGNAASGIGYAIPSNRVEYVATQLMQNGHLTSTGQGFIGIQAQDVTPQIAAQDNLSTQSGVLVNGFANDAAGQSPAQQAGVRAGDVIIAVDGKAIASSDDLSTALLNQSPGTSVTLSVLRGTSQLTIKVTLGERPTNAQG